MTEHTAQGGRVVSEADATFDQMIERASVPNLATLFERGKKAGLLKGVQPYSSVA